MSSEDAVRVDKFCPVGQIESSDWGRVFVRLDASADSPAHDGDNADEQVAFQSAFHPNRAVQRRKPLVKIGLRRATKVLSARNDRPSRRAGRVRRRRQAVVFDPRPSRRAGFRTPLARFPLSVQSDFPCFPVLPVS
jgi:hypothetical protein